MLELFKEKDVKEEELMMKAMDCADYIVKSAQELGKKITNLQLQKILFVVAAEYRRENKEYPFDKKQKFEVWGYGPVMPEIYQEYKVYGSAPIKSYKHRKIKYMPFEITEKEFNEDDIDEKFKKIVTDNLKQLLDLNVFKIVAYTHQQTFWKDNNQNRSVKYPIVEVKFQKENESLTSLISNGFGV